LDRSESIMLKIILTILAVSAIGGGIFIYIAGQKVNLQKGTPEKQIPTSVQQTSASDEGGVPLPSRLSLVSTFFGLINEKRIPEAIGMMNSALVPDESSKQAWGVQFNSLENIVVKSVEPWGKEEWTKNKETYKVIVNLEVAKEAASAPIPYYGWENGDNLRWISFESNENIWKIAGIATGP
jgi:hypothetical protein